MNDDFQWEDPCDIDWYGTFAEFSAYWWVIKGICRGIWHLIRWLIGEDEEDDKWATF